MDQNYYNEGTSLTLNQYMARTFRWMFLGLLTTFALAIAVAATGLYVPIYNSGLIFALTIGELILVMVLSARVQNMSPGKAAAMFFLYAVLNGVVFSVYFIAYRLSTLVGAFLVAALYFGVLAAYGAFTQKDLSGWCTHIFAGLIALLIFSVISAIFHIGDTLLCFVGLALFMCITAYDTQKIKSYYYSFGHDGAMAEKASIMAALSLYLDFINIFLYILRLFGRRSQNSN